MARHNPWVRHSKPVKYAFKRHFLGWSPRVYWAFRTRFWGLLEPEVGLLAHLCDPKRVFVDAGANWGAYVWWGHRVSSHGHAFEPIPELATTLRRGYRGRSVTVHEVALSNRDGVATLRIPRTDLGYSTIESSNALDTKVDPVSGFREVDVKTSRLDSMDLGPVGFLKVDVEGHEQAVIEGATETLRKWQPPVLVEAEERHREGTVEAVSRQMFDLGYHRWWCQDSRMTPCPADVDVAAAQVNEPDTAPRNLLFLSSAISAQLASDGLQL